MTVLGATHRPVDVPAVAWWSERAVPVLLVVEVGSLAAPEPLAGLATVLAVGVVAFGVMLRMSTVSKQIFPDRREAGDAARRGDLGRRLREGAYVAPEERARAGRIAWSALLAATISSWASLVFAGAVLAALVNGPLTRLDVAAAAIVLVAGLGFLAVHIRDSAHWRRIATDRFAVRPPVSA